MPSGALAEFQLSEYGAVESVAIETPRTKNSTDATGDVTSAAEAVMATLPETRAPSVGAPTVATFGGVLSTTLSGRFVVDDVPAPSTTTIRRS